MSKEPITIFVGFNADGEQEPGVEELLEAIVDEEREFILDFSRKNPPNWHAIREQLQLERLQKKN
jgi:hypothetical protein